jgi:trk system potassium uptake protein TrkA
VFVVIVGGGKVGLNVARSLRLLGHDFVVVEQRRTRFDLLRAELEDHLLFGDGAELWTLEAAGIGHADLVVAVTGDDEDNVVIAMLARHEYGVPKVVARVNDPRNQQTFDLLDVDATVCASSLVVSLIQHELPVHQFVPLLSLRREGLEIAEIAVSDDSPAAHLPVGEIPLPPGVLIGAILRGGAAVHPADDQVLRPGDQLLCLLPQRMERSLLSSLLPERRPEDVQAETYIDAGAGERA